MLTRRTAETDSLRHVEDRVVYIELGPGYASKPDPNQPVHDLQERFSMGWLHGLPDL